MLDFFFEMRRADEVSTLVASQQQVSSVLGLVRATFLLTTDEASKSVVVACADEVSKPVASM